MALDVTFIPAQPTTPINAQMGWSLTLVPQLSSGLPMKAVNISPVLVAEPIQAQPMVTENFSFIYGMAENFFPMPRIGRNLYNLTANVVNGMGQYASIYAYLMLLSNANSLILNQLTLESPSTTNPVKLTMVNTSIYSRPNLLGITAGATEAQQIVSPMTLLGSVDWANTSIGDGLTSILDSIDGIFNVVEDITNILS